MADQKTQHFTPLGSYGVLAALDGDRLHIMIPLGPEARKNAHVSSTGKSRLLASTGGFAQVPGGDGVKVNVTAILPEPKPAVA